MSRTADTDVLTLAEAVAAGTRSLADAEALLTTEADRVELRSLVRALGALRAHADVVHARPPAESPLTLEVMPGPVRRQPVRGRSLRPAAGVVIGLAAVLVVGVVVSSVGRPAPIGPGASPSPASPSPASSSPAPPASSSSRPTAAPTPPPTAVPSPVAADGLPPIDSSPLPAPNLAFWIVDGDTIHVLVWNPMTSEMTETATVDTMTGDTIERTVLFAPNGAHFAVHEINIATSSPIQRVRVFTYSGDLAWEAPTNPRLPLVRAMAWSPDGTALAIGSLPVPWTVVQLSETGGDPDVTAYELDGQDGYALLGFSEDANTLHGYGTGGEAEYWEKLVAVDRATGRLTRMDSIPPGATALSWANSTAPVDRFHPDGTMIIRPGLARGEDAWALRVPGEVDLPIPTNGASVLTWGPDRQVVGLGPNQGPDRRPQFRLDVIDPTYGAVADQPRYVLPPGLRADLHGAREGYGLLGIRADGSEQTREAVVVELSTGRAAVGLPPAALGHGDLRFAGWLGRRD